MYTVSMTGGLQISESNILTLNKTYSASNTSSVSEFRYNTYTISASTTGTQISFPNITAAQYIYIETDRSIDIQFNSNAVDAITVNRFILTDAPATAIYVSNTNSLAATVKVVIAGA